MSGNTTEQKTKQTIVTVKAIKGDLKCYHIYIYIWV